MRAHINTHVCTHTPCIDWEARWSSQNAALGAKLGRPGVQWDGIVGVGAVTDGLGVCVWGGKPGRSLAVTDPAIRTERIQARGWGWYHTLSMSAASWQTQPKGAQALSKTRSHTCNAKPPWSSPSSTAGSGGHNRVGGRCWLAQLSSQAGNGRGAQRAWELLGREVSDAGRA